MSEAEYRKAIEAEILAKVAAEAGGPTASPSVPYTKYMAEDENVSDLLPPDARRYFYSKRAPLSNIPRSDMYRLRLGGYMVDNYRKNCRPTFAGGNYEEIANVGAICDYELRLSLGEDGLLLKQLSTSTSIRRVETPGAGAFPQKSRWSWLGRRGK